MEFDDMELMQLQFCMSQTKKMMSMGGEIRRHASITQKIEEEMERRKNDNGSYTIDFFEIWKTRSKTGTLIDQ